jgi:hypothetical protein
MAHLCFIMAQKCAIDVAFAQATEFERVSDLTPNLARAGWPRRRGKKWRNTADFGELHRSPAGIKRDQGLFQLEPFKIYDAPLLRHRKSDVTHFCSIGVACQSIGRSCYSNWITKSAGRGQKAGSMNCAP